MRNEVITIIYETERIVIGKMLQHVFGLFPLNIIN